MNFGVKLCQVVWRKLKPSESLAADATLGEFGYQLIERGEYKLASRILEFSSSLRGSKDEKRRLMDLVNLANSYKLLGDDEKANAILNGDHWSITSDDFAISIAAVKGDVPLVLKFMRRLSQSGEWDGTELEQWPVFFHVRDDPRFGQEFQKLFGRAYVPMPKTRHKIVENFLQSGNVAGLKGRAKKRKGLRESETEIEVDFKRESGVEN